MIEVNVSMGLGNREMKTIRDDLIRTEDHAIIRARQELAKSMTIVKSRTVSIHKIQIVEPAENVVFQNLRLGINGTHRVASSSVDITPASTKMTIVVEQYGSTP